MVYNEIYQDFRFSDLPAPALAALDEHLIRHHTLYLIHALAPFCPTKLYSKLG